MTQQHADGDDGGQGSGGGDTGQTQEDGSTSQQTAGQEGSKTLTQEQVNAIVGRARSEERAKYADYDDLKANSDKLEEQRQAQLSKEEKQSEDLVAKDKQIEDLRSANQETAIKSEIRVKASELGFQNADDAVALVDRSGIAFDTEANAVTGAEAALTTLLEGRAYLKGTPGAPKAPNINRGDGNGDPVNPGAASLSADELEASKLLGVEPDKYAEAKGRNPDMVPLNS